VAVVPSPPPGVPLPPARRGPAEPQRARGSEAMRREPAKSLLPLLPGLMGVRRGVQLPPPACPCPLPLPLALPLPLPLPLPRCCACAVPGGVPGRGLPGEGWPKAASESRPRAAEGVPGVPRQWGSGAGPRRWRPPEGPSDAPRVRRGGGGATPHPPAPQGGLPPCPRREGSHPWRGFLGSGGGGGGGGWGGRWVYPGAGPRGVRRSFSSSSGLMAQWLRCLSFCAPPPSPLLPTFRVLSPLACSPPCFAPWPLLCSVRCSSPALVPCVQSAVLMSALTWPQPRWGPPAATLAC